MNHQIEYYNVVKEDFAEKEPPSHLGAQCCAILLCCPKKSSWATNYPPWSLQKGTRPKCEDRWQQEAYPRTDKGTCEPRFKSLFSISFKVTVNNR